MRYLKIAILVLIAIISAISAIYNGTNNGSAFVVITSIIIFAFAFGTLLVYTDKP